MYVAKRFQLRNCGHHKDPQSATECVLNMISDGNPHHYFVATQDQELRGNLRKIAGVPLLHIVSNTIVLENPTRVSQKAHDEVCSSKVQPTEHEQSVITALNSASGITETRRKRKKKPKGPNPLSVKKSRKVRGGGVSIITGGVASQTKKRRLRLQRRRAAQLLERVTASCT
jgi:U3 small nucleolar RNA-associated protein 23